MRLAMAISPSRDNSSTEPISRKYMRTGSSVRSVGSLAGVSALTIGVTVDPRLVPDVWLHVECLKASFAELLAAADAAETAGARASAPAAAAG